MVRQSVSTWWSAFRVRRELARTIAEQRLGWPANEFEMAFLVSCIGIGLLTLAGLSQSRSLENTLTANFITVWAVIMVIGSSLSLVGLYWKGVFVTGLRIKRLGLFACGLALAAYSLAVLQLGVAGAGVALFMGSFSYACFHRTAVITYRLRGFLRSVSKE